ncbi:CGNR zinc finger domain-containing protein [Microlunatus sp. Gsoil 973]|jgi:predicted RNA-binding Zn ribbon-like protein|uniref:CGNR zinc finger domain-containing protein n=1 Tax=Microlunatus sp. Gsoil 973 TaxID=2672569 RepID=UPI0012B4E575|nr:CGNR zinc finger domain-containing protein [Microlunatus sp. Gsoil 973]QGN34324.1 hypothetical protein GJV80_17545 [Microlunatus sp. Gsoil 973]
MHAKTDRIRVMGVIADLANSAPAPGREEGLATVADLERKLQEWIVTQVAPISDADLVGIRELRDRLRAVFIAPTEPERIEIINDLLAKARFHPTVVNHDSLGLHLHYFLPYSSAADHMRADCAMTLALLFEEGEGTRLKTCAAPDCTNVFYDTSKNRSRMYCDKQGCANRMHAAAYRARNARRLSQD